MSYAVKVQNKRAQIYDIKTGALKRTFSDVASAQITGDYVQIFLKTGIFSLAIVYPSSYNRG